MICVPCGLSSPHLPIIACYITLVADAHAALRLGSPSSGFAEVKLMEYVPGVDYLKVHHFLKGVVVKCGKTPSMSKQELRKGKKLFWH